MFELWQNEQGPVGSSWVKHDQRLNTVIESYDTYDDTFDYLIF